MNTTFLLVGRKYARAGALLATLMATTDLSAVWQESSQPMAAALVGSWRGTLEYRDYRTDRRVTLPATLEIRSEAQSTLRFDYRFDEGGGRFVTSSDRVTISSAPPTYRVQSADGKNDTTFAADGLAAVRNGTGTVTLTGRGQENNQDVDVRITITLAPSTVTMLRESRRPGDEWRFRNQYSFTREP